MCKIIGFESEIRAMSNKELFFKFSSYSQEAYELLRDNFFKMPGKDKQISTIKKDFISMYLIEILRRMGSSVESIKETLREHPLLQYKNGEEDFFLIE